MNELCAKVLTPIVGKRIERFACESLYADGSGPINLVLHLDDGTTMSIITERVNVRLPDVAGVKEWRWMSEDEYRIYKALMGDGGAIKS